MKKLIAIGMLGLVSLGFAGCGETDQARHDRQIRDLQLKQAQAALVAAQAAAPLGPVQLAGGGYPPQHRGAPPSGYQQGGQQRGPQHGGQAHGGQRGTGNTCPPHAPNYNAQTRTCTGAPYTVDNGPPDNRPGWTAYNNGPLDNGYRRRDCIANC